MSAAQQADAFRGRSSALDSVYGNGADRPWLIGPDPHSFKDAGSGMPQLLKYIHDFLTAAAAGGASGGVKMKAVTHHEYIEIDYKNVLDAKFLDETATIADAFVSTVRGVNPSVEVWAGEIGPHNGGTVGPGVYPNCSSNRVCGKFGSAVWYADAMGSKARAGYAAFCRQDFLGADYGLINSTSLAPSPDYWLLVLWKRLVGTKVLSLPPNPSIPPSMIRSYGFCSLGGGGGVTLVLINLSPTTPTCFTPFPSATGNYSIWSLTPGQEGVESSDVYLNEKQLLVDGSTGRLPPLPGISFPVSSGITIPPLSINLLLFSVGDSFTLCT